MTRDLNKYTCFGDINGCISHFGKKNCVDQRTVAKVLDNPRSLGWRSSTINKLSFKFSGVVLMWKMNIYIKQKNIKEGINGLTFKANTLSENTIILSPRPS